MFTFSSSNTRIKGPVVTSRTHETLAHMEKQSIRFRHISSSSPSPSSSSSSWVRGACIGRGCFGTVSTAVRRSDGGIFAVKSVDIATCLPSQAESLENEIAVLRSLEPHPCIVGFIGDDVSNDGTASFRNLHVEYLPRGDVASAAGEIDEALLRQYTWCLVSALRHVHSFGIVHCDVKARNVLFGHDRSSVKLADFGSAIRIGDGESTTLITPRGSPLWMAPEVIRREYQGPESDVWSLGCTIIEIFTGKPAWEDRGFDSLTRIGFSDELPKFPAGLSEIGRDFLEKCLNRNPRKRWSCDQLLQHPFLSRDSCSSSPRCVLDWVNSEFEEDDREEESRSSPGMSAMVRICKLATTGGANWESDGWVDVRCHASEGEGEGTSKEYTNSARVNSEFKTSLDVEEVWSDGQNRNFNNLGDAAAGGSPPRNAGSAAGTREILLLLSDFLAVKNIQIYSTSVTIVILILFIIITAKIIIIIIITTNVCFIPSLYFMFSIACDSDRTI
ncbi:PREDICTED: mitogen-activated protein kinase kinase kinase NPK1-like [Tarenaya hassleriana]|uniref:mitogen-activated protein kinase kinase kinase NPK1-like n=1 Tax=Tarenaya hassleriana TaxID=28532 RepID=UPI00053C9430|nr:PREDICTED: mitogen-activated protein kinase kinase kinase NPK1-like [Tarenaya hassleriana]